MLPVFAFAVKPDAGFALDQTVPHDQLCQVSLRFIYMNIIGEHARHAGHADILREQIDGPTNRL
jgi:hypothetical protein